MDYLWTSSTIGFSRTSDEWWFMEESRSKGRRQPQTQRKSGRNSQIRSPLIEGNLSDPMIVGKENSHEMLPLIVVTDSERVIIKLQIELT